MRPEVKLTVIVRERGGGGGESVSFEFCWHLNETVVQNLSSYKVQAAV